MSRGLRPPRKWRFRLWWEKLQRAVDSRAKVTELRRQIPASPAKPHGLTGTLVVSLTSYPPRFPTLALTMKGLLNQSVAPNRIVLWLALGDAEKLPADVLALKDHGVEIRECDDLKSYKKIIPALELFPDAFVVTADDDRYYPPGWLEALVAGQLSSPGSIVCHRARVMQFDAVGKPLSYRSWYNAISPDDGPLMPTGYGGVLYPPKCLPAEVMAREIFLKLAPTADDLWLKWMSAAAATPITLVMKDGPPFDWPGSQGVGLVHSNIRQGGNDRQALALAEHFGTARVIAS
jgi:hypothetical protein